MIVAGNKRSHKQTDVSVVKMFYKCKSFFIIFVATITHIHGSVDLLQKRVQVPVKYGIIPNNYH